MWIAFALVLLVLLVGGAMVYWRHTPARPLPLAGGTLAHRQLPGRWSSLRYDTYVPGDLVPDAPLVIVLHGAGQGPEGIRAVLGAAIERQARVCGFALAYPAAPAGDWHAAAAATPAQQAESDPAIVALIEAMAAEHAIDQRRVFVIGYDSGGQLAYGLALRLAQRLAGVAVVAASLPLEHGLAAQAPAPVLIINGTADRLNPFLGGRARLLSLRARTRVRSSWDSAQCLATLAGARLQGNEFDPALEHPRLAPVRSTWSTAEGPAVVLYAVNGGGHVLHQPDVRQPRWLGAMNPGFDVAVCACEFWGL